MIMRLNEKEVNKRSHHDVHYMEVVSNMEYLYKIFIYGTCVGVSAPIKIQFLSKIIVTDDCCHVSSTSQLLFKLL